VPRPPRRERAPAAPARDKRRVAARRRHALRSGESPRIPAREGPRSDPYLAARLERALVELPPGYRAVLVLHDVEGLAHEEIAEILGCRVGTSKSQLHKARGRMRELLGLGQEIPE